jgi:predicted nuclease of predicted toxin-antitoxin system
VKAIIDNNLPVTVLKRIRTIVPDADVDHLADLGLQDLTDAQLRRRWQRREIAWITRDEDFWHDAPMQWAVIWVSCHNPRLAFLRDNVAPTIAQRLRLLRPGDRLLITEDLVSVF